MKRIILAVMAVAVSGMAWAAEVVKTVHPQHDVVIADVVLTPQAGTTGDAARIQSAIDAVTSKGGGTIFLTQGTYTIDAPVTVKRGVTLRGDYAAAKPTESSVLSIVCGAGEEDGTAAFSLEHGSGLVGLVFHYPNQSLAKPTPYPWTVRTFIPYAGNNQTVDDCTFVNSWRALSIGPEGNECHTFRRLHICALKTGFFIDMTTDIGRVYNVVVSPKFWVSSGFAGSPKAAPLTRFLKKSGAVGADYARSDWEFIRGLAVEGYHVGIQFRRGQTFGMNGVMAHCGIRNCDIALVVDELNEVGLAAYACAFEGNATNLFCSSKFDSIAMFHSCRFGRGPLVLGPKGTVNLRGCVTRGTVDATAGGRLMREDGPTASSITPWKMAFARPKGDAVVFAEVDAKSEDCTSAIQAALNRAKDGGTVYLPAGIYRCRGTLTVPTGVELRGAAAVPHHTMNGGTVLFVYGGRGMASGAPFVTLQPGAGLRGLSFWYPEQDVGAPVAYPWTVQARGKNCWMTDVNIANSWQGADFASYPSDGHRIAYFSGGFYRTGLKVGKCATTGWVEDVQMNTHYVYRRPWDHPLLEPKEEGKGEPAFMLYQRDWLQGLVFTDCADERITGTFLYAARDGIVFSGKTKASVLIHGTDTGCRAFVMDAAAGSSVAGALVQLVALGRQVESSVAVPKSNEGDLTLMATQFWPQYPLLEQYGTGRTVLDQFNGVAGPVKVFGGTAEVRSGFFRRPRAPHVQSAETATVTCTGCVAEQDEFKFEKGAESK